MAEQATAGIPRFELRHRLDLALEVGHVSPAEMAAELGVHEKTVGNYRAGRTVPNRAALRVWALRCGVPFQWLATGEMDTTEPDGGPGLGVSPSGCIVDIVAARARLRRTPPLTADAA